MVYQISLFQGILSIQPWMSSNQRLLGNKPSTPSLLFLGNCLSTFQKKGPQDQPIYLLFPYPTQHQIHPHAPRFWRSHSMNNTRVFLFPLFFSIFSSSRHDNCLFHRDAEMTLQILFLLQPPTWTHTHTLLPIEKVPKAEGSIHISEWFIHSPSHHSSSTSLAMAEIYFSSLGTQPISST